MFDKLTVVVFGLMVFGLNPDKGTQRRPDVTLHDKLDSVQSCNIYVPVAYNYGQSHLSVIVTGFKKGVVR